MLTNRSHKCCIIFTFFIIYGLVLIKFRSCVTLPKEDIMLLRMQKNWKYKCVWVYVIIMEVLVGCLI